MRLCREVETVTTLAHLNQKEMIIDVFTRNLGLLNIKSIVSCHPLTANRLLHPVLF